MNDSRRGLVSSISSISSISADAPLGARTKLRAARVASLLVTIVGAAACTTNGTSDEVGRQDSAYTNASGESEPVTIPASYSMRSTLGTGLNTVFMKAYDAPCVEYVDPAPGTPRNASLGETKFHAQAITVGSTSELADALGIQAGMSVNYTGLTASGSVGVDFGFSRQSKTSSESVYVLVKAWGEATDLSQANRIPRLTSEALQTWDLGPYEFASKCGNNYISRRQVGAGVYLMYRFSAKEGVSKQQLHTAISGKLNMRVVSGEARAEVNMDLSEALKSANMEFTMAVYGVMPQAAPRLDNLRAQKPEEIESLINLVFQSMGQASTRGADSQEFRNLATINLQSSPYHPLLPAAKYTQLRDKFRQANYSGPEVDLLVPDMRKTQSGVDALWSQMMAVSDTIADAEYIKANPRQFNYATNPVLSYAAHQDPFAMQGWLDKLEVNWRGLRDQVAACKDGGTPSEHYAGCNIEACTEASTSAYCRAAANVAAFRAGRPERLTPATCGILGVNQELSPGQGVTSCDGRFLFILQGDGNLVLYKRNGGGALWNSGTFNANPRALMQPDGNFVLYDSAGASFNTGSVGHPNATLAVQDDGNVVVYSPTGQALWATNTANR